MTTDYQGSGAGFMGIVRTPPPPKTPRPTPGGALPAGIAMWRRTMGPEGFTSGIALARDCLTAGRSITEDAQLLLDAVRVAQQGPAFNHAEGRLAGFLWQLDQAFKSVRDAGVTLEFPNLDAGQLTDRLKLAKISSKRRAKERRRFARSWILRERTRRTKLVAS